ncbi:MAG: phage holin family protein, partial [Candidatus Levyibacteriota bacterium]
DFLFASLVLAAGFIIIKPIISALTLPLSILTLGLFSAVGTAAVLFLVTKIDQHVQITSFYFNGFHIDKYTVPSFQANILLSYVLISVTIQLLYKIILYLFDE